MGAITVAHTVVIYFQNINAAVEAFKGVKRRFEYIVKKQSDDQQEGLVFIDDYAHHPEELRALITGAKNLFPDLHCTVLFQPHLFSRTRDFAPEFAATLDMADEVILLPIYPARELPMEGVTSELILGQMKNEQKQLLSKEALLLWVADRAKHTKEAAGKDKSRGWLLITAGAGDIDALVQPIKKSIEER